MNKGSEKRDASGDEPMDNLSSLLDVASDIDTNSEPKNDPQANILADNGEVITLDEHSDKIKEK